MTWERSTINIHKQQQMDWCYSLNSNESYTKVCFLVQFDSLTGREKVRRRSIITTHWTINLFLSSRACLRACHEKDDGRITDSTDPFSWKLKSMRKDVLDYLLRSGWDCVLVPLVGRFVLVNTYKKCLYQWTWFFLPWILGEVYRKESWVHWQCLPSVRSSLCLSPSAIFSVCAMVIYVL